MYVILGPYLVIVDWRQEFTTSNLNNKPREKKTQPKKESIWQSHRHFHRDLGLQYVPGISKSRKTSDYCLEYVPETGTRVENLVNNISLLSCYFTVLTSPHPCTDGNVDPYLSYYTNYWHRLGVLHSLPLKDFPTLRLLSYDVLY